MSLNTSAFLAETVIVPLWAEELHKTCGSFRKDSCWEIYCV